MLRPSIRVPIKTKDSKTECYIALVYKGERGNKLWVYIRDKREVIHIELKGKYYKDILYKKEIPYILNKVY